MKETFLEGGSPTLSNFYFDHGVKILNTKILRVSIFENLLKSVGL